MSEDAMKYAMVLLLGTLLLGACDGSNGSTGPNVDVRGSYELTELEFDPQGLLPAVDLRPRITGIVPRLVLARDGRGQLQYQDPSTDLITVVPITYAITRNGAVRVDFGSNNVLYRNMLLSRTMTFEFDEEARTLRFSGPSPEGVSRQRLLQLVPEWEGEQLFDPVPGTLEVTYRVP